jgi:hypothetical protein
MLNATGRHAEWCPSTNFTTHHHQSRVAGVSTGVHLPGTGVARGKVRGHWHRGVVGGFSRLHGRSVRGLAPLVCNSESGAC